MLRIILICICAVMVVDGSHLGGNPGVESINVEQLRHDRDLDVTTSRPIVTTPSFNGRGFGRGGFRRGPGGPAFGFQGGPLGGGRFMGDFPAIGGPPIEFGGPPRGPPNFDQIRVENGGFPVWGGAGIGREDGTRAFDGWDGDPAKLGVGSFSEEVGPSSAFPVDGQQQQQQQQGGARRRVPETTVQTTRVVLRPRPVAAQPQSLEPLLRGQTRGGVPVNQIESREQYMRTALRANGNRKRVAGALQPMSQEPAPSPVLSQQSMADGNTGGFGGVFGPQNNNNNNGGGGGGGPFSDPLTGQAVQIVSNDMANAVRQGRTGGGDPRMGGFGPQGQGQGIQFGGRGGFQGPQGGPGGFQGGPQGFQGGPQGGPQGFQGGPQGFQGGPQGFQGGQQGFQGGPQNFQGGPQGFQGGPQGGFQGGQQGGGPGGQFGPGPQGGGRQGPMPMGPQGGMNGPGPGQFGNQGGFNNNNNNNNQFDNQGPMGGAQGGFGITGPGGPIRRSGNGLSLRVRIPADGGQPIVTRDGVTQPLPQGMSLSDLGITSPNINNNINGFGGQRGGFGNNDLGLNNGPNNNNMMQGGQGQGMDHQHGGMNNINSVNDINNMNNNNNNNNNSPNGANGGVPDLVVLQIEDLRNRDNLPAIMRALQNIANSAQSDPAVQGTAGGII